jgi:hypothetical protein
MTTPSDPHQRAPDEPIAGEPLIEPPATEPFELGASATPPVDPTGPVPTPTQRDRYADRPPPPPSTAVSESHPNGEQTDQDGRGKAKSAALIAGVAALANKVRQEAPKKIQEFRERRAAGRCVIVTEAGGRHLAVGPYEDEEAAQQDLFKVGGTAHVAELMTTSSFFGPPSP